MAKSLEHPGRDIVCTWGPNSFPTSTLGPPYLLDSYIDPAGFVP